MGHQFTIESDEAFTLATRLAAMTGADMGEVITQALRASLAEEQRRQEWVATMMDVTDRFADLLANPPLASDHSWLYDDETGLPI